MKESSGTIFCNNRLSNKEVGNNMWRIFVVITLFIFTVTGCQPNNIEEVVNENNDIQNVEGLNSFVEDVKNQNETEIKYVQYGTEGQRGVMTLKTDGNDIHVSHTVDGEFIEEFNCEDMIIQIEKEVNKYILSRCTGDFEGDFELLSVPN